MQSTLRINVSDSMPTDSGSYYCQVTLTVNDTDNITANDTSNVLLKGKHILLDCFIEV